MILDELFSLMGFASFINRQVINIYFKNAILMIHNNLYKALSSVPGINCSYLVYYSVI